MSEVSPDGEVRQTLLHFSPHGEKLHCELLYIDQKTAEGDTVEFTYSAEAGTELFFGEFAGEEPADDYTPGDVNGDGDVLANDARLALRASAQLETLEGSAFLAADVNEDGKILADDARQILRFSAHLVTEFVKKTV